MSDISIRAMVNSWSVMQPMRKSIMLIGYCHTGRTTLAELIKKYYYNNPTPGLTYDNGKYILDNVISVKTIKLQTVVPVVYGSSPLKQKEMKVVDVPSFALTPDTKKWTGLQQKVTVNYMLEKSQKMGFVLFIDEKSTRTNITSWKKTLQSFLQLFSEYSSELLDSVAMIVTKAPPDTKDDTMVKRLRNMYTTLQKQKCPNIDAINRLVNNIIEKERFFIFKKVAGDETQKEEVLSICSRLQNLANYQLRKEHLKDFTWNNEEQKNLMVNYINPAEESIDYLLRVVKQVLLLDEWTNEGIRSAKRNRPQKLNIELQIDEGVKKKIVNNNNKGINHFQMINSYIELKKILETINQDNFTDRIQQIFDCLIGFAIFDQEIEDLSILQTIYEAINFRRVLNFKQFQIQKYHAAVCGLLDEKIANSVFTKLIAAELFNSSKEFYQKSIQIINNNFKQKSGLIAKFYEKCQFKLIKYSQPREALQTLCEMLKQSGKDNVLQILLQIAETLKKIGLIREAISIFKFAKSPQPAIECYKQGILKDQKMGRQYLLYLSQLYLFETSKKECYRLSQKWGPESRKRFGDTLREVMEAEKKYFNEPIKTNYLLQQIQISTCLKEINGIIVEVIAKL